MDEIKDENIQEGGAGIVYASSGNIDGLTQIQFGAVTSSLVQIKNAANEYKAAIGSKLVSGGRLYANIGGVNTEIKNGTVSIPDKPLFLSDLLKLLNPTSDISAIFNVIPLAQFKHLPDPTALNPVAAGAPGPAVPGGGGYDEEPQPFTSEDEELPSLVVEEATQGGSHKRSKRSSHKKNKSARIRTKKNKKL